MKPAGPTGTHAGRRTNHPPQARKGGRGQALLPDRTMTWGNQAAHSLAETLANWLTAERIAAAAAAVDETGTVIATGPPDLPAGGRFEIGSVTKTMTATVLASLVAEGTLGLDDPIGRWLSAGLAWRDHHPPARHAHLRAAAVAQNRQDVQSDPANPWAGYTFERAEEGLRLAAATPGNPWRYSNLGYQLIGLILQRASGTAYPALLTQRLLAPLGMTHSGVGQRGAGTLLPGHAGDRQAPTVGTSLGRRRRRGHHHRPRPLRPCQPVPAGHAAWRRDQARPDAGVATRGRLQAGTRLGCRRTGAPAGTLAAPAGSAPAS